MSNVQRLSRLRKNVRLAYKSGDKECTAVWFLDVLLRSRDLTDLEQRQIDRHN
jgi:hypothetical protein